MRRFFEIEAEESSEPEEEDDEEHEIRGGQNQYYTKEQLERRFDPKARL
jgi:transcription elongation factor SPT5